MSRRKPTRPPVKPTVPTTSAVPRRFRKRLLGPVGAILLVGLVAWGAWAIFGSKSLREARAALDRRDFRTADDILAKRLTEHPDDPDARLLAARTARRAGEFDRARAHLRHYAEKNPQNEAYELEANLLTAQAGDSASAERLFATYSVQPDEPETPFVMEAYIEGTLKALVPNYTMMIDLDHDDPSVVARLNTAVEMWLARRPGRADQVQGLTWQGRICAYAREYDKSVAKYREALALDPSHFDARFHLALALVQSAPEECIRHFEILLEQRPKNRFLRFLVATVRRKFGQFDESRRVLDAMLTADSNDLAALLELGLLDLDEGKITDAEPLLQRALKLAPNGPETNLAMSRYQLLAGHPAEAERYRKRFEEVDAKRKHSRVPPPLNP